MRASIGLTLLIAGPLVGSILALLIGRSRWWQVVAAAVSGEVVVYVGLGLWSILLIRQITSGRREGFVASLPQRSWSDQMIPVAALLAFAAAVGGLVLIARRLTSFGRS